MKKIFSLTALLSTLLLPAYALDLTAIPLGDGKISSSPKAGYVYSCQQNFNASQGGAGTDGPWIHGSTWNLLEKISVSGNVAWPNATVSTSSEKGILKIESNSLPVGSHTGTFPVQSTDPAYSYDRNPNTITPQSISLSLPNNPTIASAPTCVGMGMIGVAVNGVAIFNALDAGGRDAVAHEVQDTCEGHPQQEGEYHYHGGSSCMPHANEKNAIVGYALDGFPITSNLDANGKSQTNADLDECHGTTSTITINGKDTTMYHYVLTNEYPYTIGCFKGTPVSSGSHGTVPSVHMTGIIMTLASSSAPLNRYLFLGSSGDEVIALQTYLERKGFLNIPQGMAKGFFGSLTKRALMNYQKENNIEQTGTVGPKTRKTINAEGQPKGESSSAGPIRGLMLRTPPKEAIEACRGKSLENSCSFSGEQGETVNGSCIPLPGDEHTLTCGPSFRGAR